jgi:superfamily II DNA/RNA helicase
VLVLSPTRELSAQIVDSFTTYGRYLSPRLALAIGGVPMGRQIRALAGGVDVLVATPGRLLDLVQQRALLLDRIEIFVLDEADRMLDMGFIHDIRRIVAKIPKQRQTLFFSATMPREIAELAQSMLRDPVEVAVTPAATTVERIAQRVVHVERADKPGLLVEVLRQEAIDRALIFTRTKRGADKVARGLAKSGIAAEAIHGNKSQNQRERVLAAFRAGELRTLVATDIAARGIDVEGISHVVNYDLPNIPESYVHRIGRTARAGADGVAISFCDGEERAYLRDIEKLIRIAIPATDRRGQKRSTPARTAAAPAQQPPRREQPKRQQPQRQHAPQPQQPRAQQQSRSQQSHQPRHGHGPGMQAQRARPKAAPARQQQHAAPPTGDIGAMTFMQPPRRRPAGAPRHATR